MEDWLSYYESRCITADEAALLIPPHSHVSLSDGSSDPRAITRACERNYEKLFDVSFMQGPPGKEIGMFGPEMVGHLRYTPFVGPVQNHRGYWEGQHCGAADYLPTYYSAIERLIERGQYPIDVALISVTPPDERGYCTFGVSCSYQRTAISAASLVIAQVNDQLPRVHGEMSVHVREIDYFVVASEPVPEIPEPPIGDAERKIGEYCASLIEDGSTIQAGIGKLPNAVLEALVDKKDLGVHSELFNTHMMTLAQAGALTASKKTLHPGVNVAAVIQGTKELYDWVDDNPAVALMPVGYVNDPYVIAKNDKMVSINSCIEVDLFGQVCAESFGYKQATGAGGQVDFVRGATLSKGGKSIIAINSTAAHGTVSKISCFLTPGSVVTTPRDEVQYIVTEYGIADLRGKTNRERANALISIAHPDFRDELCREYQEHFGVNPLK